MHGMPQVLWTCDRCSAQETKALHQHPEGWTTVLLLPKLVTSTVEANDISEFLQVEVCKVCTNSIMAQPHD